MAGAQDYMVGNAPLPASFSPPPIDFSAIAQIPGAFQQGARDAQQREQYQRTRAIQTALPKGLDEFKDPETGDYDYRGLVNRLVQVAGPEGAGMADQLMNAAQQSNIKTLVQNQLGHPPGQPDPPAQSTGATLPNGTPISTPAASSPHGAGPANLRMPSGPAAQPGAQNGMAPNSIIGMATDAYGAGAAGKIAALAGKTKQYGGIDPNAPLTNAQVDQFRQHLPRLAQVAQARATNQAPQNGPPFATGTPGMRNPQSDQQNTPPGGQIAFNDRVPPAGGMNRRSTVTEDGTAGQPAAPTSSREAAANGPGVVSPTPSSGTPSRYQFLQQQADEARRQAYIWALAGQKETAEMHNKRAEALDARAKEDPQYMANVEGSKDESKSQVKLLSDLADSGVEAKGQIGQLNVIKQLGDKVGYGVVPKIQSFAGKYGIDTNGLTDIQAYERAIDYMAPQLRPIGSGRLMQQELAAFKSSLGGLMTTPEGRRISLENLGLIANYKTKIGQIAADTTLSPSERIQNIYAVSPPHLKTTAPDQAASAAPPKIADKASYDALPKGAQYLHPDGTTRTKQ